MSAAVSSCPKCGQAVPADAPAGLCPRCLVAGGFTGTQLPANAADESDSKATLHIVIPEDAAVPGGAPRQFGKYQLLEEIARGGMGVVYKARHTGLDSVVAVKLIRSGVLATPTDVERFQREAKTAAKLRHPNIVTIHDIGEQDGQHYFSMDYVAGANLAELTRTRPFSPKQAAEIVAGVASAIHFAHQQGVLHRDLKPANVILTPEQQPRVLDFGLARHALDDSQLTQSGAPMGSPSYMPPEQCGMGSSRRKEAHSEKSEIRNPKSEMKRSLVTSAATKRAVGPQSDVYGLGAMLYELVTGRPPFQAASVLETLKLVLETEPASPRLVNPNVPPDLETICLKCLEKTPAKRYPTAQALAEELGRFLRDEPIKARRVGAPEKLWRWCRRKPALAASLAGILVLALTVLIGSPIAAYRISQARRAEQTERLQAQRNLYAADMILAQQALGMNNLGRARELLERHRPAEKSGTRHPISPTDIRGWEWHYLWNLSQSDELPSSRLGPCALGSHSVVLSPDGKLLAAKLATEETLQVWDLTTKKMLGAYTNSIGIPWSYNNRSCAFSPDGRVVAVAWVGGVVRRFQSRTLKEISPELHVPGEIEDLYYSPDGKALLVVSFPGNNTTLLTYFDTGDDRIVKKTSLPGGVSWAIAADQRTAAVGLDDCTIEIYELANGVRRASFKFAGQNPDVMTLSTDGAYLAIADAHHAQLVNQTSTNDAYWAIADRNPQAELWDVTKATRLDWVSTHAALVRDFAFSPDGKRLATTSFDQAVKVWEVPSGKELMSLKGHEGAVYCASFMPDGQTLVTGSKDETIRFWNTQPRSVPANTQPLSRDAMPPRVWLAPTGDALLIVRPNVDSSNLVFSIWNVPQWAGTEEQTISLPNFKCAAVSPGGRLLAFAHAGSIVLLWDVEGRRALATIQHGAARIARLQFSADGRLLAVATENSWTRIWQVTPTNLVAQFAHREPSRPVVIELGAMCFSHDGAFYAQAEGRGLVEVWNLTRKESVHFWKADGKWVSAMAFSPDGKTVATTGYDCVVRLWDLATGKKKAEEFRTSNHASMSSFSFSPDGGRLIATMADGSVKLWDTTSAQELLTLKGHKSDPEPAGPSSVTFSHDGETIVAASRLDVTRWSVRTEARK